MAHDSDAHPGDLIHRRRESISVVAYPQLELKIIARQANFNVLGSRVPHRVSHRLGRDEK